MKCDKFILEIMIKSKRIDSFLERVRFVIKMKKKCIYIN